MADSMNHPVNILELLDGMPLPVSKAELIAYAEDHDASEEVLDLLQAIPGDTFNSISQINNRLGLMEELPGAENLWSSEDAHDLPNDREMKTTIARGQGRL